MNQPERGKILIIDDDVNLLMTYRRVLGRKFNVEIASGPRDGLTTALSGTEYAVILCDLHMPKVDGLSLLTKVRELSPNTVRLILTGDGNLNQAIEAVNQGIIFRFLCKPCPTEVLIDCLEEALKQYDLCVGGESLMRDTLAGTVKMLSEVFAIRMPETGACVPRIHAVVSQLVVKLHLADAWEFELAASLSQLGIWAGQPSHKRAPKKTLNLQDMLENKPLNPADKLAHAQPPALAAQLVGAIPRLEGVAQMLGSAWKTLDLHGRYELAEAPRSVIGAQMLRIAADFDRERCSQGCSEAALHVINAKADEYFPEMVSALSRIVMGDAGACTTKPREHLQSGMVLGEDLITSQGQVLATRGQQITPATQLFLRDYIPELPPLVRVQEDSLTPGKAQASAV